MTDAEALDIGRAAVIEAVRAVGLDACMAELDRRAETDDRLRVALKQVGHLLVQGSQSEKH